MRKTIFKHLLLALTGLAIIGGALFASFVPVHAQTPPAQLNPVPLREMYNQPNQKYLYSSSWGEVTSAQKNNGMKLSSQRPLAYVFTNSNTDTKPIYRLKQNSTGAWIMSVDQGEITYLQSHGFTMEGVTGNIYTSPQYGAQQLNRYTNGKGWRLAFQSQDSALKAAGYTLDGPVGYALPTYYQVGAYYFSAYDATNPDDLFLAAVKNAFGRYPDPWGGVRDFHGDPSSPWGNVPQNTQGWGGDWSYLKPSIGYYDDSQVSTLEAQIDQAANAGLSYFSFYDYWNNQKGDSSGDTAMKTFLQASNTNRLQFMLSIVIPYSQGDPQHLMLPTSQFNAAAENYSNYMSKGNYLMTQEGRPIVFMEDGGGIGSGSVADQNTFISLLKQKIKAKTGKDAYIVNHSEHASAFQVTGDAYGCLNIGQYVQAGSYSQYISNAPTYFNNIDTKGKPMMRCGMSGFNEAPRTGFWEAKSDVRYFKDDTKSQFPAAMTMTLNNMKSQPASPIDNYMTMYAWNEWAEGGIIEPNVRDGSYYLNNIQSTFVLPPR